MYDYLLEYIYNETHSKYVSVLVSSLWTCDWENVGQKNAEVRVKEYLT
jgi:hypothetical protein